MPFPGQLLIAAICCSLALPGYTDGGIIAWSQKDTVYRILRFSSGHTSFPDTGRANRHLDGDGIIRQVAGHYDDSSVLIIIPPHFKPERKIDMVFWFHGWHNNIDTAMAFYGLARQFAASGLNAVLVLPETAKNAADSYGGKLQQKGMFKGLVDDVIHELKKAKVVANATPGRIALGGHSGAFLVIANILQNGEMPVDEVFLFDALYGQLPVYLNWIQQDKGHHFVHWFTNHGGGTDEMSDTLMLQLRHLHLDYQLTEEEEVNPTLIRNNRILFVHSPREHNVIINNPDDFRLLLENGFSFYQKSE